METTQAKADVALADASNAGNPPALVLANSTHQMLSIIASEVVKLNLDLAKRVLLVVEPRILVI